MGFLDDAFGGKVKAPKFEKINIDQEIQANIESVKQNAAAAGEAAQELGLSQADTAIAVLERFLPGSKDLLAQSQRQVASGLRGEIPADVQRLISDRANALSVSSGVGFESGFRKNLELRDLGLTSLNRIDNAISQSTQLLTMSKNLVGPVPTASSFFLTPQQRIAARQQERNSQYQAALMKNQLKAAPDPFTQAAVGFGVKLAGTAAGVGLGQTFGSFGLEDASKGAEIFGV